MENVNSPGRVVADKYQAMRAAMLAITASCLANEPERLLRLRCLLTRLAIQYMIKERFLVCLKNHVNNRGVVSISHPGD
jgi:hypothetical protein